MGLWQSDLDHRPGIQKVLALDNSFHKVLIFSTLTGFGIIENAKTKYSAKGSTFIKQLPSVFLLAIQAKKAHEQERFHVDRLSGKTLNGSSHLDDNLQVGVSELVLGLGWQATSY